MQSAMKKGLSGEGAFLKVLKEIRQETVHYEL
jgi:hypothetical protein